MAKAIVLVSGGLDSLLTVKLMQKTKIPFQAVHFDIGLTNNKPILAGQRISKYFGLEYLVKNSIEIDKVDIAKEFYSVMLSKQDEAIFNVYLEHRVFLLQKAKEYMETHKADFIVTGDIIDQHPLIQSKNSLLLADQKAGTEGLIFRPLCAVHMPSHHLKEYPELASIIYDFEGFTPARENLAKKLNITEYPPQNPQQLKDPEPDMGKKAFEIFEKDHFINPAHLNRLGIHFEFEEGAKGVIGRTPFESNYLKNFYNKMKPEKAFAFYTDSPRFLFGFIYGNAVNSHYEQIASRIFCGTICPKAEPKNISFSDHEGNPLGIKHIIPLDPQEFKLYLTKYEELKDMMCPLFFHEAQKNNP